MSQRKAHLTVTIKQFNSTNANPIDANVKPSSSPLRMSMPECQQQGQSRFFAILPRELRDLIYALVLTKSTPISPQRVSHRAEERDILPLLQTCRRIHAETAKFYFSSNTFRFFDDGELADTQLPRFFRCIGSPNLGWCGAISLEASLGPRSRRRADHFGLARCFRKEYCVGSIEVNLGTLTISTSGRTNCCESGEAEELLLRARQKVQAILLSVDGRVEAMGAEQRARLGSEVGLEFCATFEHLHPDYGD